MSHTIEFGGWRAHFDSGLDDCSLVTLTNEGKEVSVPAPLVKEVVAEWVRSAKITDLEAATTEELLLGDPPKT